MQKWFTNLAVTARVRALIRATALGSVVATLLATPGVAAAQQPFPGSSGAGSIASDEKETEVRQDSPGGQSQVVAKKRVSYKLDVQWQVVDDGLSDRDPFTLEPRQENVCADPTHQSHAECGTTCRIHPGGVSGEAKGQSFDLNDNMERAHRDSIAQNREVGSTGLAFDSAATDIRKRTRKWAEEVVRVSGASSRSSCSFTSHTWQRRHYILRVTWTWKRTTRTLSAATGGRWSDPVTETLTVSTPTTADIMVIHRLDPGSHTSHDVVVCSCGAEKQTPKTTPKTTPQPPPVRYPTPTHRETSCAPCRGLATQLNAASDKFNQAVAAKADAGTLASLFADVGRLAQELTDCEKTQCPPPVQTSSARMINVIPGLRTGAVNATFQNMIVEGIASMVADASPHVPSLTTALASLREFVGGGFVRPSAFASTTGMPASRPVHSGDVVALRTVAQGGGPGEVAVSLIATGNSTGSVFRLQALNTTGQPVSLGAPDGLVLQPLRQAAPAVAQAGRGQRSTQPGQVATQTMTGYCLDFAKLPPAAGTLYRVGDDALQQQFAPVTQVLRAGRKLAANGTLHPDSEPTAYADAIKQWAVWGRLEHWNAADFERHFVDRTRKNVEVAKQPWTRATEQRVRQLVPNRWNDITAVWADADATAAALRR